MVLIGLLAAHLFSVGTSAPALACADYSPGDSNCVQELRKFCDGNVKCLARVDETEKETEKKYSSLREKCGSDKCCLISVDAMEKDGGNVLRKEEEDYCPEEPVQRLSCPTSYRWCKGF
jgi:hypothetical protein